MKLQKLSAVKNHTLTVLYGNNGTGKSTVIGTMPGKVLIIDTDNGLESVDGLHKDSAVAVCESYQDVIDALNYYEDFDSIAIDTFDKVQEYAIALAMEKDGKTYGKDQVQLNHYGTATQYLLQLIQDIVKVAREDKNVLVLTHEKQLEEEDKDNKTYKSVTLNLMPKVGSTLMASARIIGFTFKDYNTKFVKGKKQMEEVYRAQFGGNPYLTTKVTRKPSVKAPNIITNLTWDKAQALITGIAPNKSKEDEVVEETEEQKED